MRQTNCKTGRVGRKCKRRILIGKCIRNKQVLFGGNVVGRDVVGMIGGGGRTKQEKHIYSVLEMALYEYIMG